MLYVGVDAHKTKTHVTVLDEAGGVVRRKQITSSPAGVREVLGDLREPMKAVFEASYCWGPMYDWLAEFAEDVVLAHPAKVRAIADARIKTDAIDSRMLAHLLRADLIPVAYAPSKETRARKRVLRQRMFLVRLQTMLKNRIQTLLSQHIVVRPDVTDLFGKAGLAWLHQLTLSEPDGQLLRADLTVLALLAQQIAATDRQIAELAAGDPIVAWIASLPRTL